MNSLIKVKPCKNITVQRNYRGKSYLYPEHKHTQFAVMCRDNTDFGPFYAQMIQMLLLCGSTNNNNKNIPLKMVKDWT